MNKFWSQHEGLILTDIDLTRSISIWSVKNMKLIQSILSSIRTNQNPLFNDKEIKLKITL